MSGCPQAHHLRTLAGQAQLGAGVAEVNHNMACRTAATLQPRCTFPAAAVEPHRWDTLTDPILLNLALH